MKDKIRPPAGAALVELREAAGLTQKELAATLQVHEITVATWETKPNTMRTQSAWACAGVLASRTGQPVEAIFAKLTGGESVPAPA